MTQGESLKAFTKVVHKFCQANAENAQLKAFVEPLAKLNKEWGEITLKVGMAAMKDREEVGAAAVDYLMYSGYCCLAYFWADMARVAAEKLAAGTEEAAFYQAKLATARFYYERLLPRTRAHCRVPAGRRRQPDGPGRGRLRPRLLRRRRSTENPAPAGFRLFAAAKKPLAADLRSADHQVSDHEPMSPFRFGLTLG